MLFGSVAHPPSDRLAKPSMIEDAIEIALLNRLIVFPTLKKAAQTAEIKLRERLRQKVSSLTLLRQEITNRASKNDAADNFKFSRHARPRIGINNH